MGPLLYDRTFALDDIQISRSGDGRTVEAYAAMFDSPYEVRDQYGHYLEVIDRAAFNRTLKGGGAKAICVYNHGMSLQGTPDALASVPLGTPLEIRADGRGLLTVTRYNRSALADSVLEAIRAGDIRSQSFRGAIYRSDPSGKVPRSKPGYALPTVRRHELGLADYGPTPIPVNAGAEIMAVRSVVEIAEELEALDVDGRLELLRTLGIDLSTHDSDPDGALEDLEDHPVDEQDTATSDSSEPGAEDPPAVARHSGRLELKRELLRRALELRGVRRGEAA